jgi:hypothetical protein
MYSIWYNMVYLLHMWSFGVLVSGLPDSLFVVYKNANFNPYLHKGLEMERFGAPISWPLVYFGQSGTLHSHLAFLWQFL